MPVVGSEINPAAFKMANVYCQMRLAVAKRKSVLAEVEAVLTDVLPSDERTLFSPARKTSNSSIKDSLIEAREHLSSEAALSLLESLIVLLDFSKEFSSDTVFRTWGILKSKFLSLPFTTSSVELLNNDARSLPLEEDVIHFVLTSPPYINVFNYHQQYRKSVEALGWNPLAVARAEIGSNRKHRQNRFLTVIQYCLDMTDVLRELQRVCQAGSRAIMILGRESNVLKTRFFNGEIMMSLAMRCLGFEAMMRQERRFKNRFGEVICEDILHFEVKKETNTQYDTPRTIAEEVLTSARQRCPSESIADLEEAINEVHEVQPSQMFDLVSASNLPIAPARSVVAS